MDIQESVQWVLRAKMIFGKLFYDALFERHPSFKEFFKGVDMNQQTVLLTTHLTVIAQCYPSAIPTVDEYLRILGAKHKRKCIPREACWPFRDVLLETLGCSFGPVWEEDLAAQWSHAINAATERIFEGYEQDLHELAPHS